MDIAVELAPWMSIDGDTLAQVESVALSNLAHNAAFFPNDAHTLANITLHCIREVRAVRTTPVADPVREAAERLVVAYRDRYRNATGGFRANAPMYAEVAALNAALLSVHPTAPHDPLAHRQPSTTSSHESERLPDLRRTVGRSTRSATNAHRPRG